MRGTKQLKLDHYYMPGAMLTTNIKKLCDEPRPRIPQDRSCGSLLVKHDGSPKSVHRRLCAPLKGAHTVANTAVNVTLRAPWHVTHVRCWALCSESCSADL
jgi:hypothetical protein